MQGNNLKVGIIGLPNVGKSALFNLLTKKGVPSLNFPFCTIDPSIGIIEIKDERIQKINNISNSQKVINNTVSFVDIAGLVKGASKGEGLGNAFLSHIRDVDVVLHLIRVFRDENVTHVEGDIHPMRDLEIINTELILADMEVLEKRKNKIAKDVKQQKKEAIQETDLIEKALTLLMEGKMLYKNISEDETKTLTGTITRKPMFFVLNADFQQKELEPIKKYLEESNMQHIETNLGEGNDNNFNKIVEVAYDNLGLINFFTTGPEETRAWSCLRDSTAPQAGSVIHSDFETKFIKAEVVSYEDFISEKGYQGARQSGKLRVEGKTYVVKDGDIITYKV